MRVFFLSVFLWCLKCAPVFASLDEDGDWASQTVRVQAMDVVVPGTPDPRMEPLSSLPYVACLVRHCLGKCTGISECQKSDADFEVVFEIRRSDMDRFAKLFDGCDEETTRCLNYDVKEYKPTDAEMDALLDLKLAPIMRMGALNCKDWIPLSAPRADHVVLLKKLLQGCDAASTSLMCGKLRSYTTPDCFACLEEIAAAGLSPEVREEFVSMFRRGYLPRSALHAALKAERAVPFERLPRLLAEACDYPDPAAYINEMLQANAAALAPSFS